MPPPSSTTPPVPSLRALIPTVYGPTATAPQAPHSPPLHFPPPPSRFTPAPPTGRPPPPSPFLSSVITPMPPPRQDFPPSRRQPICGCIQATPSPRLSLSSSPPTQ